MRRRVYLAATVLAMGISLVGCSYNQFEDGLRSKFSGEKERTTDIYGEEADKEGPEPVKMDDVDKNIFQQGDTVESVFGMDYRINRAYMVSNLNEEGIAVDDLKLFEDPEKTVDDDGNIVGMDINYSLLNLYENPEKVPENRQYALLLLDVTATNRSGGSYDYDRNGDISNDAYLGGSVGIIEGIEAAGGMSKVDYCYLTPHGATEQSKSFVSVEVGENIEATYGFLVPKDWEERELYYIIQVSDSGETKDKYGFVRLNVEKGE